jgi:hypothetical protein
LYFATRFATAAPPAGADQDLQRLCLLERIDRVVADPDEFEARVSL